LDAELDRFIANLGAHPLALDELRQIAEDVYVSLSQSQAAGFDYAFCLNSGGRIYFFFKAGELPSFDLFRRKPDCLLSRPICNVLQFSANVRLIYPFSSFGKAISGEHGFDHGRVVPASG
jgi:hypothetical protein